MGPGLSARASSRIVLATMALAALVVVACSLTRDAPSMPENGEVSEANGGVWDHTLESKSGFTLSTKAQQPLKQWEVLLQQEDQGSKKVLAHTKKAKKMKKVNKTTKRKAQNKHTKKAQRGKKVVRKADQALKKLSK